MKQCPRCGTSYGDDLSVCPLDGATLASGPREDPLVGRTVKGRYRIVSLIGAGGMGAVYRAEQLSVGRTVALKVLHREFTRDEEFVQRFQQEARLAAALNHPRLTTVFDFDQSEDGRLFIVMEYLEGTLLSEIIRQSGPLEVDRAVRLGRQVAEALAAAHRAGIIHRDVKPQNVMVLGPGDDVKLMDFGIARLSDGRDVQLTRAGTMMGTPLYMAPEQVEGRAVSEKTDIYAFGVVMYEMLSGRTPFSAPTSAAVLAKQLNEPPRPLRAVRPDVPALLERIVMQALDKDPEFRQDRVAEIVRGLTSVGSSAAAPDQTHVTLPGRVSESRQVDDPGDVTMVAGRTIAARAAEPESRRGEGAPPAAPSRRPWLHTGVGKTVLIATGLLVVVAAAGSIWWFTRSSAHVPVVTVPTPLPAKPKTPSATPIVPSAPVVPSTAAAPVVPSTPTVLPTPTPSIPSRPATLPPVSSPPLPASLRASVESQLRAAKLLRDPPDSPDPGVEVKLVEPNGRVHLKGVLRDATERRRAHDVVSGVSGVTNVVDTEVNLAGDWK